ncbi:MULTISPECIES: DUF6881 domain-containing protein [Streptomycetaceae]|uniref:DUF6881 domain-containing protein n=1 Tax=Streptomycetaceae TaxID=2062 RepID=UPI0005A25751|nr:MULTISPECIES: hypothetical protein [Streptomycetaceae]MYS57629.1 hypothetical protein [Streptomyces sp. SID5468]
MEYIRVDWIHELEDEPVTYLSEIGEGRYEIRKVQIFRDGRTEWADAEHETATVGLSEIPFLSLEEIDSQSEFVSSLISAEDFEQAWIRARES